MTKFDTVKIEKELRKLSKEAGIKNDAGTIQLIINNICLYNYLLDELNNGDDSKAYLIYQMSSTIFKQLAEFNVLPDKKKKEVKKTDNFLDMIKQVEKR